MARTIKPRLAEDLWAEGRTVDRGGVEAEGTVNKSSLGSTLIMGDELASLLCSSWALKDRARSCAAASWAFKSSTSEIPMSDGAAALVWD